MKFKLAVLALAMAAMVPALQAQLNIPNADGSDGALIVGSNTVIDLSKAVSGSWTATSASPGNGTYDPAQWAVVFKYSSVVISNGATVSFLNNATHAPVVWLVSGDVTINGALSLNGQPATGDSVALAEPGPGGFRGGAGSSIYGTGSGFGPGGGTSSSGNGTYSGRYGNPQILPLIGGSGGLGYSFYGVHNGNGGGGAILIAAAQTIAINSPGACTADGGTEGSGVGVPSGSGGAIRLVASQITGGGVIEAVGGNGNNGIIRLEANSIDDGLTINPYVQAVAPASTPTIFPDATAPSVSVLSISNLTANVAAPVDPKATMNANPNSDDFTLVTKNAVTIWLQTLNFPTNGTVTVFIKSRNAGQSTVNAALVSGNTNSALWEAANVTLLNPAHTVVQARAAY